MRGDIVLTPRAAPMDVEMVRDQEGGTHVYINGQRLRNVISVDASAGRDELRTVTIKFAATSLKGYDTP